MAAGKFNIKLEQGAKYNVEFLWQDDEGVPVDLTDYVAQIQFRDSKESETILYDSDTTGDIVLGTTDGKITLTIPTLTTAAFEFDSAVYDLEMTLDTETERLIEGRVYVSREVTK